MACDFGVGPPTTGEHGHGEFRGRQVVSHVLARIGVMDAPPAVAEAVCDLDDVREVVRVLRF